MSELAQRIERAAESILENESLTANLDDAAAQVLFDWGIACARVVAQSTAGLDDGEAESVMSERLRATRRLMRLVNQWAPRRSQMDAQGNAALLIRVVEQAAIVYGRNFTDLDSERRDAFLSQNLIVAPQQAIVNLRALIENLNRDSMSQGGENG